MCITIDTSLVLMVSTFSLVVTHQLLISALHSADDAYPESAYVYALSLAVITHTVAKACIEELIHNCTCSSNSDNGCADNITHGLMVAQTFLNKHYSSHGGGLKLQVIQHNLQVSQKVGRYCILDSPFLECENC